MNLPLKVSGDVAPSPEEVRFRGVEAAAFPSGERIGLTLRRTPSSVQPNLEGVAMDDRRNEVACASVIGTQETERALMPHPQEASPSGRYTARLTLHRPDEVSLDQAKVVFGARPWDSTTRGQGFQNA